MRLQFTVLNLLILTTVVAFIVAFEVHGPVLTTLLGILVPVLLIGVCFRLVYKLQISTATRLAPFFYSRRMLWVLRWTCGKTFTAWALCNYAGKLSATGQNEAAIKVLTRVLNLDASKAAYWAQRGAANNSAGKPEAAEQDLTRALTLDRHHEGALVHRGITRISLGKYREAVDDLSLIDCSGATAAWVALWRGCCHELLGEWHEAICDYQLAYELDRSTIEAGIGLARLQAACPAPEIRNGAIAVENALSMCVREGWKNWIAVSVLAAGHAEAGNWESAIKYAKQALDLAPDPEKPERQRRLDEFKAHIPYRIPQPSAIARAPVQT